MLLGSGDGPKGMIRRLYGGDPAPVTLRETVPHCVGVLSNVKLYAAARAGKAARAAAEERNSIVDGGCGVAGHDEEERVGAVEDGGVDCGGRRQKDGAGAQPVSNGRAATVMRCLGRLPLWLGCPRAPSVWHSFVRKPSQFDSRVYGRAVRSMPPLAQGELSKLGHTRQCGNAI